MEDSIQQYIKAAEDLRELIREGHELLKDLRAENATNRELIRKFEDDSITKAKVRIDKAQEELWERMKGDILNSFKKSLDTAVAIVIDATDKHTQFMADQADTLALAMQRQSPQAARDIALIARQTYAARKKKRGGKPSGT